MANQENQNQNQNQPQDKNGNRKDMKNNKSNQNFGKPIGGGMDQQPQRISQNDQEEDSVVNTDEFGFSRDQQDLH